MTVIEYVKKMPGSDDFIALETTDQDQWIFQATDLLKDHFTARKITTRIIALQTLFMYEGDAEDFAQLRRQGVKKFSADGLSVTLKDTQISPVIISIMDKSAGVGSLI